MSNLPINFERPHGNQNPENVPIQEKEKISKLERIYNPREENALYYPLEPQMQVISKIWTKDTQIADCQFCGQRIHTVTYKESGTGTWIVAGVLCCFGCWCCAWMPFADFGCKDVEHQCQNCYRIIGEKRFLNI